MVIEIYTATSEDLLTIVRGLKPQSEDCILALCASGDQAVALALEGARVIAVDTNVEQLRYVDMRLDSLRHGDFTSFINPKLDDFAWQGTDYYEEKYEREINPKVRNLYFMERQNAFAGMDWDTSVLLECGDIVDAFRAHPECNKVYLGDVIPSLKVAKKMELFEVALERGAREGYDSPLYFDSRALETVRTMQEKGKREWLVDGPLKRKGMFVDVLPYFDRSYISPLFPRFWKPATYQVIPEQMRSD